MCSPWKSLWSDQLDGSAHAKVTARTSAAESFLMEKPLRNTLVELLTHPPILSWVPIDVSLHRTWLLLAG